MYSKFNKCRKQKVVRVVMKFSRVNNKIIKINKKQNNLNKQLIN